MKIALCFSGQPRYIEESYEQFSRGLFEKNDVDVYSHFWWDESYKGKPFVWESSDRYPEDYDPLEVFSKKFKPKWTFVEAHKPKEFFGYSDFPGNCVFEPNMESDFAPVLSPDKGVSGILSSGLCLILTWKTMT